LPFAVAGSETRKAPSRLRMAQHALHSPRVHLTIDGDQLTWTIQPKGLTTFGLILIAAGLASAASCGLLAVNVWEQHEFLLYIRLIGAISVASTGVSLATTFVYLALRDGWARAVVTFDREKLTIHEVMLSKTASRHWSRDELKAIT